MTGMPEPTIELWNQSIAQISEIKERVRKLKEGCCMPGRLCMFDDLIRYIEDIERDLRTGESHALVGEAQRKAIRCGEVLGKLAVSCCTYRRNEEYAKCIGLLRRVLFTSLLFSESIRGEECFPDIS